MPSSPLRCSNDCARFIARPSFSSVFSLRSIRSSDTLKDPCQPHVGGHAAHGSRDRHGPCTTQTLDELGAVRATRSDNRLRTEEMAMLYYALVFLVVGLVAGALGMFGIAAIAAQPSWFLFLIALVFLIIHLASGRRMPMS